MRTYSQGEERGGDGWGDGKLLRGDIKGREILDKPIQQNSCWRQAWVIKYRGCGILSKLNFQDLTGKREGPKMRSSQKEGSEEPV